MLRSDVTVEQRVHKLCTKLRRQHARNPSLLPISAVAAFILISLVLYLLASPGTTNPRHLSTTFLHASVQPQQSPPADDTTTAAFQPGITPPTPTQPLSVRALSALRAQLETRILVHDFEACITIRRMMALVGEDRETGRRRGTGEADVDLDAYLAQLRQRVDNDDSQKQQQQQQAAAQIAEAPLAQPTQQQPPPSTDDGQQQQMAAGVEEEWRGKVVALQEQVRELQAEMMEAKIAAEAASEAADKVAMEGRRRGGNNNNSPRITFSKIKQQHHDDTATDQPQPPTQLPLSIDPPTDVVHSPEEATLEKEKAQHDAGQPADGQQPPTPSAPTPQSLAAAAAGGAVGAPAGSDGDETVFVAGIQGGARLGEQEAEQKEEEAEWGKQKRKNRWQKKQLGREKKKHDDDD